VWPCDVSCESPTTTGSAARFATEVVWGLSGRQFGLCTVKLRPCRRECDDFFSGFPQFGDAFPGDGQFVTPALIGGQWFNLTCGGCTGGCSCTELSEVVLPAPVYRIVEVRVDGAPLVTGAYHVDDNRLLIRTDGLQWPTCNNLNLPDTEVGTWSVTAEFGIPVPEGGAWAVGELACEFMRALRGDDCRLPQGVTQLVRQNVTISFPQITELLKDRVTGMYLVDMFLATWNPNKLTARSAVYSVDGALARRSNT
jgi:hypothetical protein